MGLTEVLNDVTKFLAEHPAHTLCEALIPLSQALRSLMHSSSPVAAQVGDVLCEYGAATDGTPEAVLVVPRRTWLTPVRDWLASEDFDCVDTACLGELRSASNTYRATILVGHPAVAFSSRFRTPDMALREMGWLMTAPVSPTVQLVLPSDAPRLTVSDLWLLPADAQPELVLRDDGPEPGADLAPHDWRPIFEVPGPVRRTPRSFAMPADGEAHAVELQMASGHAAYFDPQIGPRPHVVTFDDETRAVSLSAASVGSVARGWVLAIRVGAVPHTQVVDRADTWLQQRKGWSANHIATVRAYSADLRCTLLQALQVQGHQRLLQKLAAAVGVDYARVLLRGPLDERYIAPRRRGFEALVNAIAAPELLGTFDELATVRTAHQQAGEQIRREIPTSLSDGAWVAEVDDEGWTVRHAEGLGTLLLAKITARISEPIAVPHNWLGVLIDEAGHRVTELPMKEETP
ncbi:hypothetical protein [Mycobacterium sp. ST-F2]|uniref:hypothetical protein n=1 Tax=Mycobacterium sp. ST-F2 TaxID=1490484 RepID=UPI00114FD0D4|nr:hypothetical protein [Mycobacterium sp. ST-F2]